MSHSKALAFLFTALQNNAGKTLTLFAGTPQEAHITFAREQHALPAFDDTQASGGIARRAGLYVMTLHNHVKSWMYIVNDEPSLMEWISNRLSGLNAADKAHAIEQVKILFTFTPRQRQAMITNTREHYHG